MKIKFFFALAVISAALIACGKQQDDQGAGYRIEDDPLYQKNYLNENGNANCYIVTKPGQYLLKPVKGNSDEPVGEVVSTQILWKSFGTDEVPGKDDIISYSYVDATTDIHYVAFSVLSPMKNGNAVIAALDRTNTILWSWHIWVCEDYDPDETAQIYYGGAGTVMDRNLGATSATPGDVGALGLMYQWGRKDPFLGGDGIKSSTRAASTAEWPAPVASGSGKDEQYTREHPMVFITNGSGSWKYGDPATSQLWSNYKSVEDPCPPGWRVPDGHTDGLWQTANNSLVGTPDIEVDEENRGVNFFGVFGSSDTIWYPAAGFINNVNGVINDVGNSAYIWSVTNSNYMSYLFGYDITYGSFTLPQEAAYRSYGQSVRCVKE